MTLEKKQREGRETYWMSLKESDIGHTNGLLDTLTANTWKAARTALLTELRDSGLLEELDAGEAPSDNAVGSEQRTFGSNRTKRAIKAHLDELIKSTH